MDWFQKNKQRISALQAILVYAVLNTALPEEILFRGFLLKRISAKFGKNVGNFIQSLLFGIIHGVMLSAFSVFRIDSERKKLCDTLNF